VSAFGFFVAWANAPFAIAAGVAAVFALLQVTGLLGLIAHADHADGEVDHDVDGAANDAVHGDAEANPDGDHEHDVERDVDRAWGTAALAPLGFGKIPFSVIWQVYAFAFAVSGFAINLRYLGAAERPPLLTLAWTVPSSLLIGYVAVALVAKIVSPVLSSKAQEATSRAQLVGQIGVVISSKVDQEFGEIRIRDKDGHDVRIVCKLPQGSSKSVSEHQSVVVVEYDDAGGALLVEPLDEEDSVEQKRNVS
jgi:membrane protein implicated in regulation of membrane protease activity